MVWALAQWPRLAVLLEDFFLRAVIVLGRAGHLGLGQPSKKYFSYFYLSNMAVVLPHRHFSETDHLIWCFSNFNMNINHFEFLFKCKDLDGAQESSISNRLLEMVSHLSEPHWVARLCWITRKPNSMVGQFLYLPGLELQKLSLAKSTNSPKGEFTSKK